jgi:subtilisin-like proprotein convertase family protein
MKISRAGVALLLSIGAVLAAGCDAGERCGPGTVEVDGACVPDGSGECGPGTVEQDGECVPDGSVICETGTTFNPETGTCVPDITGCAPGTVLVEGECVPEGEVRDPDVEEGPEPNDDQVLGDGRAVFELPAVGQSVLLHGCIDPYRDALDDDGDQRPDGEQDPDVDAFVFEATGPTLLDITVDGVGGAAGGFKMLSSELADDGWIRFGINLTGDTTQQQVFLPVAGTYTFLASDSRSVLTDLAAGGPEACYFASIASAPFPEALPLVSPQSGALGSDVQFWRYAPETDGQAIENLVDYTSASAAVALVAMVNGEYRGSTRFGGIGGPVFGQVASLSVGDDVRLLVEPITNFSLTPVATSLAVATIPTTALPEGGAALTLNHSDAEPVNLVFFQADAGDMLRLEFDPAGTDFDVILFQPGTTSFDPSDEQFISQVCDACTSADAWVQLRQTGYYYLAVTNLEVDDGDSYDVAFTLTADTPVPLELGAPATGSLAGRDRDFFEITPADLVWLEYTVAPANFDGARLRFYPRGQAGELDEALVAQDEVVTSGTESFGRIVYETGSLLVSVENAGGAAGDEEFSIQVDDKVFVDAGRVERGAPIALADQALAAGQPTLVFLRAASGDSVRMSATGDAGADLVLEQLDRTELALYERNRGAGGAPESLARLIGDETFLAVRVGAAGAPAGSFDLNAEVVDLERAQGASAPAVAIPDDDGDGITDTITLADDCSVATLTVDVDVTHPFRSDVRLTLISPLGTSILLKRNESFDPEDDVVGTFPTTLEPVDSLDALIAEEAAGAWGLNAADLSLEDGGTLNAWGVNVLCM